MNNNVSLIENGPQILDMAKRFACERFHQQNGNNKISTRISSIAPFVGFTILINSLISVLIHTHQKLRA